MDNTELIDQSAEYMRLALPLMRRHGVAMTPANYTVWFEHVSGANAELSEEIEQMTQKSPTLSEDECFELYDKYFNTDKERRKVEAMRTELTHLLKEVIGFIYGSVNKTDEANTHLNDLMGKIHRDLSPEQVHIIVEEIISETRLAVNNGELLSERLNTVMEEMNNLKKELQQTRREAKSDTLTGLANRKAFDELVNKAAQEADTHDLNMSLIFADLDLFKNINDKHGHLVGDQVLKVVANVLRDSVKGRDLVARYGGEEFAIILLNTSLQNAKTLAEHIRKDIAGKRIQRKDTHESLGDITMSFGVARYIPTEGVESFMQRADRALYMSKRKGRNSVSEAPPPVI